MPQVLHTQAYALPSMPDQPPQEVTSFKTRTHHGSGKKETYDLKACVFLEDARLANDRALEVPREMRLSLLRWDYPADEMEVGDHHQQLSRSAAGAVQPPSSQVIHRDGGVAPGLGGGGGGDDGWRGAAEAAGSPPEGGRYPGGPERPMQEAVWMLCNLDDNLLFSQFHLPPGEQAPPPPQQHQQEHRQRLERQRQRSNPPIAAAAEGFMSSNPYLNKPDGVSYAANSYETLPLSARHTSAVTNGAAATAAAAAAPLEGDGVDASGRSSGGAAVRNRSQRPLPSPPIKQPVLPSRREERVTFHARPTCHDFLRGWEGGRARAGGVSLGLGGGSGGGGRRRRPREEKSAPSAVPEGAVNRGPRESLDQSNRRSGGGGGGDGDGSETENTSTARGNGDGAGGGRSGGGGSAENHRVVERIVAVGFKSGECAVLDATVTNSASFISVLNKGGAYCEGRVTAVRFVPGAGHRLFVAAFSTGEAFTFDTSLAKEAPMGAAAEKASSAERAAGGGAAGSGGSNGGAGSGAAGKRRMSNGKGSSSSGGGGGGSGAVGRSSEDSIGSNGGVSTSSAGSSWGKGRSNHGSSSSSPMPPPLPASFTSRGGRAEGGPSGTRAAVAQRGDEFVAERNRVEGANPVSRWRVSSDGREITSMAFAPCEVDGQRVVALAALDGAMRVVDYDEQVLLAGFRSWFGGILCLDWSPDGRYIVTGGEDDAVTLWCLESRTCVLRGEGHGSWVTGVAFDYWASRPPYYRFTSVGEDARLCMWEHDEMAGSLLHGAGGKPGGAPSPNRQQRYKSSENLNGSNKSSSANLSQKSKSAENLSRDGGGGGVVEDVLGRLASDCTTTGARAASLAVEPSRLDNTWPLRSKNARSARFGRNAASGSSGGQGSAGLGVSAPDTARQDITGGGAGGAGTRNSLSLPSRGALLFGLRAPGGGGGDPAATGTGGGGCGGGGENRAGGPALVHPALSRQAAPRGEPLCCKRLAETPLSQVMVVRAGVVTLCAEGLLKLWARPSVPPPLSPLRVGGTRPIRIKDNGDAQGQQEVAAPPSPSAAPSARRSRASALDKSRTGVENRAVSARPTAAAGGGSGVSCSGSAASRPTAETAALAGSSSLGREGKSDNSNAAAAAAAVPPAALDALINTEIHTPRADGGEGGAAGGAPNGKRKSFFSKVIFSKSSTGRNSSSGAGAGRGGGGGGGAQNHNGDNVGFAALSAANAKGREPVEVGKKKSQSPPPNNGAAIAGSATGGRVALGSTSNPAGTRGKASSSSPSKGYSRRGSIGVRR